MTTNKENEEIVDWEKRINDQLELLDGHSSSQFRDLVRVAIVSIFEEALLSKDKQIQEAVREAIEQIAYQFDPHADYKGQAVYDAIGTYLQAPQSNNK